MLHYQGPEAGKGETHNEEGAVVVEATPKCETTSDQVSQAYSCIRYDILQLTIHV